MNSKYLLLLVFINCACVSLNRSIPDYVLIKNGYVVGSNSSVLLPSHQLEAKAEYKDGLLSIDYPVLIKNTHPNQAVTVYLDRSMILTNEVSTPVKCIRVGGGAPTMFIEPQLLLGILCSIKLRPDSKNKLAIRDTRATLKIHVTNGTSPTLDFPVVLRMEDFND